MKKLLALLLVMILAVGSLTACSASDVFGKVKDTTVNVFDTVKKTVGGWFGIEFEEENEDENVSTQKTSAEMAIAFINNTYGEADEKTSVSYTLIAKVSVNGGAEIVNVVWTTNNSAVTITPNTTDDTKVNVTVPAGGDADLNYVLTATVTDAAGNTETASFNRVVPSVNTYTTLEEYYAAAKETNVVVKGVVSAIVSKSASGGSNNHIYLNDESGKGGYYVYKLEKDPVSELGLKVGMTVKVSGEKDIYKNAHEIKNATVEILDSNIKTVTPVDITSVYTNAEAVDDKQLDSYQGLLVTIKGVELTSLEVASSGFLYYHFTLDGVESYMGVSHSKDNCMSAADVEALIAKFDANKGSTADITGIAASYDGNFYIVPNSVNSLSNFKAVDRTDAEKVEYELDGLEIDTTIKVDTVIDLVTAGKVYSDVAITWTSNNNCAVVSEDGKTLTITIQDEAQTVTLTASAKIGDMTPVEKTFTVNVAGKPDYVIETVTNPAVNTAYKLYLFHATKGENMFLTGKFDATYNYNLGTTGDLAQAPDFYLEAAEGGGYYLTVTVDNVKKYVNLAVDGNYVDITTDLDPITAYTFNTTVNTLVSTQTHGEATKTWYFGTYASNQKTGITTSETYRIEGSNAANVGVSQFVLQLVTVSNLDDMTDAEKAQAQADKLVIDTDVTQDTEITLPVATVKGTTVEWSVTENATIVDGKLVITLESAAKTVVLTATVKAGTADPIVKTFTFEVPKLPTVVPQAVYQLEEGKAYKLVGKNANGYVYFSGTCTSGRIDGVTNYLQGVDVYVKYVDKTAGTFLIYFTDANEKTMYIDTYEKSSSKTSAFKLVEEADLVGHWSFGSTNEILTSVYGDRFLSTNPAETTYTNFSTYSTTNNGLTTYFAAFFAVMVETDSITNEDKVDAELEGADITITEVSNDVEITLPTVQQYTDDVTFTWAVDNACAVVTDGKLVITVPATDVTLKVTLTVSCGEGEDKVEKTKEFTITVDAPVYTVTDVTEPAVDKAYKLYFYQENIAKALFLDGGTGSRNYYLSATTSLIDSVDAYLVAVEGGYNLKIVTAAGETKYINIVSVTNSSGTFINSLIEDAPVTVYTFNAELHTLVASIDNVDWIVATDNSFDTVSAKKTTYSGLFIVRLVEVNCTHEYTAVCDDTCDACGAVRTDAADHVYTNVCDDTCDNNCGYVREVPGHTDEAGDGTCDNCGGSMAEVEKATIEEAKTKVVIAETYANSVKFELPTAIGKVTIAWTAEGVTLNGNVVTVKLGTEAKTAKLIATYTCGATTSDPVEYALTLNKAPTLDMMEVIAPEANKAYQLYFYQANNNKGFFLDGSVGSQKYYITGSEMLNGALTAYLVEVTGGYNLKVVLADGTEKYLNIHEVTGGYINSLYETLEANATPTVYTFDKELGTLSVAVDATDDTKDGTYVIAGYGTYNNVSATLTTKSDIFVLKLVEAVCYHEYSADCDASCNACGYVREGVTEHVTYDNACDTTCICGYVREVGDHVDVNPVDSKCDNCGLDLTETYTARIETVKKTVSFGTKTEGGITVTLVTVGGDLNSVKVEWTATNAVITTSEDGVTTVTFPNVSGTTVTLKATYTCGTVTEEVEYTTETVKSALVLDVNSIVGKPVYIKAANAYGALYFSGSITSKRIDGTSDLGKAVAVYFEVADAEAGTYYIYYYEVVDGETTKKVYIESTGNATNSFYGRAKDELTTAWTVDAETGKIATTASGNRFISTQYASTYYNFSTYAISNFGTADYCTARIIITDCPHSFETTCGSCSICGEAQANAQHTYANDCDETCDGCGETRVAPHAYASECDTTCDCGATRETNASHEAEYACLGTCKNCGETFTPVASHVYDGCTDTDCNNGCGTTREASEHDFDECSTQCNNCTETRDAAEADHTDGDDEDILCDYCGKVELGGADTPDQDVTVD